MALKIGDLWRRLWTQEPEQPQSTRFAGVLPATAMTDPAHQDPADPHSHKDFKNFIRHDLFLGFLKARGFHPETAYDVGAYNGEWARWFRRRWTDSALYLFEPLAEMAEPLHKCCEDFPNTQHLPVALGPERGDHEFFSWDKASRSSFLGEVDAPDWGERTRRVVPVETIDHLVNSGQLPPPDLIKLAVQGAELLVLQGAEQTLPQVQIIVAEVSLYPLYGEGNPTVDAVVAYLSARGFVLFDIIGFARRPVDHALLQADFVFVRAEHPLRTPGPLAHKHDFDW